MGRCKWVKKYIAIIFWHPISRIAILLGVICLNFFFLAEDPLARSKVHARIYIVGQAADFVIGPYPPEPLMIVLKVPPTPSVVNVVVASRLRVVVFVFGRLDGSWQRNMCGSEC